MLQFYSPKALVEASILQWEGSEGKHKQPSLPEWIFGGTFGSHFSIFYRITTIMKGISG